MVCSLKVAEPNQRKSAVSICENLRDRRSLGEKETWTGKKEVRSI
jgi:hypothetical protein